MNGNLILMEIISPRGMAMKLYKDPSNAYYRYSIPKMEDTQVRAVRAFMEQEMAYERVRPHLPEG